MRKLTIKQQRFVDAYEDDIKAASKAVELSYGYCRQLVTKPNIIEAIRRKRERISMRAEISQTRVLEEEKCIFASNLKDIFNEDGCLIPPQDLPETVARSISSVEVNERWEGKGEDAQPVKTYKYKFWDKGKSLERVSRHLGMYIDRKEIRFDHEVLNAILSGLPAEFAGRVRRALSELVSDKRN
jgi:phage terminase small subunit